MSSIVIQLEPFVKNLKSTSDPIELTTYIFPSKECCSEADANFLTVTFKSENKQPQFNEIATQTDTREMAEIAGKQRKDEKTRKEVIEAILQDHHKAKLLHDGVKPKFRICHKQEKRPKHLNNSAKERFMEQQLQHSSNQSQILSKSINMPNLDLSMTSVSESNFGTNLCATSTPLQRNAKPMMKLNEETIGRMEEYFMKEFCGKESQKQDMMRSILRERVQEFNSALVRHNLGKCTNQTNTKQLQTGLLTNKDDLKELCIRKKCYVKLQRHPDILNKILFKRALQAKAVAPRKSPMRRSDRIKRKVCPNC